MFARNSVNNVEFLDRFRSQAGSHKVSGQWRLWVCVAMGSGQFHCHFYADIFLANICSLDTLGASVPVRVHGFCVLPWGWVRKAANFQRATISLTGSLLFVSCPGSMMIVTMIKYLLIEDGYRSPWAISLCRYDNNDDDSASAATTTSSSRKSKNANNTCE